ncbi:MAG: AMP-binding protein [Beijerinckiaceae bacterium]|jgi:long-chain acyl-CoA synthetase|nr:AMP-binding protein [Beijerinckiaceae bacterium]
MSMHAMPSRPWLAHYPANVPAEIDFNKLPDLATLIRDSISRFPDRRAFESFGKSLTYRQIGEAADAVGGWLQAQGFKKGDRIAMMMPNVMAYPAAMFGTLLGGFTVVNVNPLYTMRELVHQLNDSGAEVIFVLENFAHVVQEALPHTSLKKVIVVSAGDLLGFKGKIVSFVAKYVKKVVPPYSLPQAIRFEEVVRIGRGAGLRSVQISLDDVAFLQYTGGTTGVSKGATLTHRNISANVAQAELWLGPAVNSIPDNVMVTALPLYHIFALTCCCLYMMKIGAACLLIANPRDIPGFIATLKKSRFTLMSGVNTLYNALANHPDIRTVDFTTLKFCVAGGMATQSAVAKNWKSVSGCAIIEGYGLSETSPILTVNRVDLEEFSGTIGFPVPSTDMDLRDAEGKVVPTGEAGEICARGPQVMQGYWQRPDETAKVMTADGFFRTGDIGVQLPDGTFKIVDRLKDMILVSGFNVYPNEVEEVIAKHPGVLEVAVIGVPDPQSTEAVAAYIVRKDPDLQAETIRAHCRSELTAYKVPKVIHFRDSLPKTNVGKVLRRMLREPAA